MPAGTYSPLRRWMRSERSDEFRRWLDARDARDARVVEGVLAAWFRGYWFAEGFRELRDQTRPTIPSGQ